jgi:hypothetical protein
MRSDETVAKTSRLSEIQRAFAKACFFYPRGRGSEWLFEPGICAEGRGEGRHGSQLDCQANGSTRYGSRGTDPHPHL